MSGQPTTRTCDNCGQPVLPSDIECWHCGTRLRLAEPTALAKAAGRAATDKEDEGAPVTQVIFYAIMTAVVALALLFVTRTLGQQPRLTTVLASDDILAVELVDPAGSFSIMLPKDLTWYFPQTESEQGSNASKLVEDPRFNAALQPWLELAQDSKILLLVEAESGIISIARSARLSSLSAQNVTDSLSSEAFTGSMVMAVEKGTNNSGTELATITVRQDDPPLICRQHFIPASGSAFVAAICTDGDQFDAQAPIFDKILNSLTIR